MIKPEEIKIKPYIMNEKAVEMTKHELYSLGNAYKIIGDDPAYKNLNDESKYAFSILVSSYKRIFNRFIERKGELNHNKGDKKNETHRQI